MHPSLTQSRPAHCSRTHLSAALVALLGLGACASDTLPSAPETAEPGRAVPATDAASLTSDSWISRAAMPTARAGLVAATVNGLVYAMGGQDANGNPGSRVEMYNPDATLIAWSPKRPLPAPRAYPNGAAVIAGKIYLPGGKNAQGAPTKSLFVYNVTGDTWTTKAKMPVASFGGAAAAIDGKLYVLSTPELGDAAHSRLYRYDPSTNSWTERRSPPDNLYGGAIGVINGKLYVAGGLATKADPMGKLNVYNPATNGWTTKAEMPTARNWAVGRVIGGKLYVAGGVAASGASAKTEVYDPATNTWAARADMPAPRYAAAAAVAKGLLYVLGGTTGSTQAVRTNEAYVP